MDELRTVAACSCSGKGGLDVSMSRHCACTHPATGAAGVGTKGTSLEPS